jgi:HNH endonuclease
MKLKITLAQSNSDGRAIWVYIGKAPKGKWHHIETEFEGDPYSATPINLKRESPSVWNENLVKHWICRGRIFLVEGAGFVDYEELLTRIQHAALKEEKDYKRIQRELQALENLPFADSARRERIPDDVRMFVWQRDEGKCVKCQSNLNLEFDHIIPIAEGGSSTSRNIQLLCEPCNRKKGKSV